MKDYLDQQEGSTGWINWPTHLNDTGEGGMWVYAFWVSDLDSRTIVVNENEPAEKIAILRDSFVKCFGPQTTLALPWQNFVVSSNERQIYVPSEDFPDPKEDRDAFNMAIADAGVPVLAAVCLGTSVHSWTDYEGNDYWSCTEEDLTKPGHMLVASLNRLYGREAILITYLDTISGDTVSN